LIGAFAHYVQEHDYPWGVPRDVMEQIALEARESWS
jgi:hypothetical protein